MKILSVGEDKSTMRNDTTKPRDGEARRAAPEARRNLWREHRPAACARDPRDGEAVPFRGLFPTGLEVLPSR